MQINKTIYDWMVFRGVNQTTLCRNTCINIKNFNSFLKGKRPIPVESLIKVMEYMSITFCEHGCSSGDVRAAEVREIIRSAAKNKGYSIYGLSKMSGVDGAVISRFLSRKCNCSSKTLERLMSSLNICIAEYEC